MYVILWNLLSFGIFLAYFYFLLVESCKFWCFFLVCFYFLVLYVTSDQNYSSHCGVLKKRTGHFIYVCIYCTCAFQIEKVWTCHLQICWLRLEAATVQGGRSSEAAAQEVAWPRRVGAWIKREVVNESFVFGQLSRLLYTVPRYKRKHWFFLDNPKVGTYHIFQT